MQDSNYVILVDENGQPYIAHSIFGRLKSGAGKAASTVKTASGKVSSGVGRGVRTAHKYLLKVGEGAKAQYAYTKEEIDALMGRGRRAVGEAAEKGRAAASSAAKRGREALSTAGTKARSAVERGKDVAGYDERERRDRAQEKLGGKIDTSTKEGRQAWQDFEQAQREYMNTPLGRLEYAKEQAKEIMSATTRTAKETASVASDKAKEFGSDIKSRSERMREEFRDKASKAADKVKGTAASLKDKASEAVDEAKDEVTKAADKVKGTTASLKDKASEVADKAKETVASLKDKASEAVDEAKDEATKAADKVKGTAASLKDKASEVVDEAKDEATKAADKVKGTAASLKDKASSAVAKAKDIAGVDEKEAADKAWDEYERLSEEKGMRSPEADKAFDKASELNDRYLSTPLGKIDSSVAKFQERFWDVALPVEEKAKEALDSINDQVKQIASAVKVTGDKLKLPGGKEVSIPEKYIEEQIIPESFIEETIIKEQIIPESFIEETIIEERRK